MADVHIRIIRKKFDMKRNISLFLYMFLLCATVQAQEVWSLEKCIQHAAQNNLSLRQAEITVQQAELDKKTNEFSRYPNLEGQISGGFNFGRTIVPTTNDFINDRIGNSRISLNSNMTVYNGGRINNSIKQSELNIQAARADAETFANDVALQISQAYLNVLLAQEQVVISEKQVAQTQTQLTQTDKRIQAGVLPKNERLEILAQKARNQQNAIAAQNNVAINLLTLKNFLELEPSFNLAVAVPENIPLATMDELLSLETIYNQALETQPSIKASKLKMQSAELNIPIAKSQGLPSVFLFGSINSNYANVKSITTEPGYFRQLDINLGQTIGAQVNIPIYNRNATKIAVEQARLGIINAEVQNRQAKQQLKADVQTAIANARAGKAQLAASEVALEAAKASLTNAERMFELGAINTLEFTNAKTNFDTAELDVVRAKYDYLFRLKIIDFYLGKNLSLD